MIRVYKLSKQIVAIICATVLLFSLTISNYVVAAEIIVQKTDDSGLTYTLYDDNSITITGDGIIVDRTSDYTALQWMTIGSVYVSVLPSDIKSITIGDGITKVGNNTFYNHSKVTNVSISSTVTTIGDQAFMGVGNKMTDNSTVFDIKGKLTSIGTNAFRSARGTIIVHDEETKTLIESALAAYGAKNLISEVKLASSSDPTTAGTTDAEPTTIEPTTIEPTTTTEPTTAEVTTVEPTTVAPTTVEPTTVPSSKATVKLEAQFGNWATPNQILYINESGSYSVELTKFNVNNFKNVGYFKYEPEKGYEGEKCKITVDSIDITAQDGTVYNLKLSDMYLNRDPGSGTDNGLPNVWNPAGKKAGVATSADGTAALDYVKGVIEFRVNGTATNFKALKYNLTVTLDSDAVPTTAEPTTVEPTAPAGAVMGDLYYADADWFPQMHDYVVIDGDGTYTFNLSSNDGDSEGAIVFVLDFKDALSTNPDLKAELVSIDCNGTNMTIDQSKVKFGHLEQDKNNLRLEIYNYYGATNTDSPIDQKSISFPKGATMKVTVKVSDFNGAATTVEPTTVTDPGPTTEPTTVEPTTSVPVARANVKFAAQLDNWSDLIQTIPIGENGDVSIDFTGLNANGFKNIGFFKYEPEKGYDGEKVLIDVTSIEITDGNGETYVMTLNDMNIDRDPGDATGNGLPNIWNDAGKADVVASTADGTAKLIGAEDSNGYIAFLVNGDKAQVTGVKYNLTVKGLNEQSTTTDDPTEETTVAPDPTEETTVAPDPTEETTAADPTEATTSDTEPTTATDPETTTAGGNDAQTTTASPATTKSAGTTVAASTTKAATTTKAASGTTTSTDKTVNTGAEAAVGLTIFMAAGIAGAVALKKRRR